MDDYVLVFRLYIGILYLKELSRREENVDHLKYKFMFSDITCSIHLLNAGLIWPELSLNSKQYRSCSTTVQNEVW